MNIYNLKYFADSAKMGSITKAAETNNLSRPAISQAIQKLEDELGVKLLDHKRRSFILTDAGRKLLLKSEEIFKAVQSVKDSLSSNSKRIGDFKIGCARTLATFKLQDAIADLQKKFPEVCFKIVLANSEDIAGKLESREIDLAFFLGDDTVNGCKQIVIRRGYYCLIKPKKVQGDLRFAMTERRPETERARVLYEREHAEPLPLFAEIPSWDAIWTWAKAGVCGGLVPDFLINADSEGTKEIKILFPKVFPYEVKVMYPKTKSHDPLIADFIERVRSW